MLGFDDRQLSIVISELFSEVEHRFCVRHMYANFFDKGFKGKILKDLLQRATKSTTVANFRQWIQQIHQLSEVTYKWLMERNLSNWTKSHLRTHSKNDILTNNLCEVFNKMLINDKEKLIMARLKDMQLGFMTRIEKCRTKMGMCRGRLCPRIKKGLPRQLRCQMNTRRIFQECLNSKQTIGQILMSLTWKTKLHIQEMGLDRNIVQPYLGHYTGVQK